jgi:uncharacterized membrane protein YhaH (DUF805 family)
MKKIFEAIIDGIIGIASWDDGVDKFRFITYIIFIVVAFQIFKFIFISNALFVPYFIFGLFFLVSTLSIVSRLLTYLDMSFCYLLLAIIPIINIFLIIYLMVINPKKSPNTMDYRNIRKD